MPLAEDVNPDPNIFETTITAEPATVDIGNGVLAHALTFNGQIPGPTFKLKVGETVIVHYHNHLSRESGVHWHGAELANEMDGSPFTQNQVPPGGSFLYKFTANRPGIFWYHPHHHASTNQLFKGLYGMILVSDPNEAALQASGTLPPPSDTLPIVLSDTTVCKAPGANDTLTYPLSMPHVEAALAAQEPPTPKNLCEGPSLVGPPPNPYPVDEDGSLRGPYEAGDIPAIQTAGTAGRVNEGQTVLTNGKNVGGRAGDPTSPGALEAGASVMTVQPGQGLRLQVLSASTTRYFRLKLTGPEGESIPLIRVGGEGGLLNEAVEEGGTQGTWVTKYKPGEILLPPGSRADVVAAVPESPKKGVITLWTEDYKRTGKGYADIPTVPVMHMALAGPTVSPPFTISAGTELRAKTGDLVQALPEPKPGEELLNPATFTPPKLGLPNKEIKFTQNAQTSLGVDNILGTHEVKGDYEDAEHLGSSRYAKVGDTLELEVKNTTGADHPFHLHGFSIQPVRLTNGAETFTFPTANPEFRDNVNLPAGFTLRFRVKITERPQADGTTPGGALGRWLFHCHIFFHAEDGMISELVVTAPDGNERPNVNIDNPELETTQGGTVTDTGTYKDPDGDPVKLTASQGTVTDKGGGKYSWTHTTGATEGSHLVFITATDSHGLKGQIPLYLKVKTNPSANAKPVLKKLRVKPNKFAPAKALTKLKRANASKRGKKSKGGAKISFTISEAAKVQFTIKRLRPKRPKVKVPKFSRRIKSGGKKKIRFTARFKRIGALPPGKYKLSAQATDSGGLKSKRVSTKFQIVH